MYGFCNDKGFTGIEALLPNVSVVVTPLAVVNSKTHCLSADMIESEILVMTVHVSYKNIYTSTE